MDEHSQHDQGHSPCPVRTLFFVGAQSHPEKYDSSIENPMVGMIVVAAYKVEMIPVGKLPVHFPVKVE